MHYMFQWEPDIVTEGRLLEASLVHKAMNIDARGTLRDGPR